MVGDGYTEPGCIIGTLAAAAVAKYAFGAYAWWQKLQKFEHVGHISGIVVYPVKSCAGIAVDSAMCSRIGVKVHGVTDRHWMVTRSNGDFLSQRQIPKMSLIKTSIHGDQLFLEAPGMSTLKLSLNPPLQRSKVVNCRVWDSRTEGQDCGDAAADWLSQFLEHEGVRLLFSAEGLAKREACEEEKPWGNPALPGDMSAYADLTPYLILTEESLACLNTKLRDPVEMRRFRPNIVIKTNQKAFAEDTWKEFRVGDGVYFRLLDPCTRCRMTTVDPNKGEMSKEAEPLTTLKSFRCFPSIYGASPIFGMNGAIDVEGGVKVGDSVYALRK